MANSPSDSENTVLPVPDSWRRRVGLGRVLNFLFALLPPIGVFAPLGVAPFLTVVALAVVVFEPHRYWAFIRERWAVIAAMAVIALWGTLTSLWSILPAHSALEGGRLLTIIVTGSAAFAGLGILTESDRLKMARVLAVSVMATIVVLLVAVALDQLILRYVVGVGSEQAVPLERFDRGTTVLGLIFWPVALALWSSRRYPLLAGLIVATLTALVLIPSTTNRLAMVIGLIVWVAASWQPRVTARVMAVSVMLLVIIVPYALPRMLPANEAIVSLHHQAPWLKFSALHRLLIWRFTSERIAERPWFGWGMDASREIPGNHTKLVETLSEPVIPPNSEALPLHPHNAFFQWHVELGLPAALFCGLLVALLLWRTGASGPTPVRAASLACAAAGLTIALLGYGVWQAWWMSTLWLAAALLARPFPTRL